MEKQRLDKIIAGGGAYSRREVKLLIRQGNQYRLQHAEAFFAEYENREENGRSHLTEQTERT